MSISEVFRTYFFYLMHPYKTHQILMEREISNVAPINANQSVEPLSLSVYESLGTSWVFVVISGIIRILIIGGLIQVFLGVMDPATNFLTRFYDGERFLGFYFLILTTILDVIFYPLITLFVIQFWEFTIKAFASLAKVDGDVDGKTKSILSVALSSHILLVAPIVGEMAQKTALFTHMYAGIRQQLNFSRSLTICVLLTPVLLVLSFLSLIVLLAAL